MEHLKWRGIKRITLLLFVLVIAGNGWIFPGEARSDTIVTETWSSEDLGDGLGIQDVARFTITPGASGIVEFAVGTSYSYGTGSIAEDNNLPTYDYSIDHGLPTGVINYTASIWTGATAWKDLESGKWYGGYYGEELTWMEDALGFVGYQTAFLFTTNQIYFGDYTGHPGWTPLTSGVTSYGFLGRTHQPESPFAAHVMLNGQDEPTITGETTQGVPEPATLLLLGVGFIGLAGSRRKFKN